MSRIKVFWNKWLWVTEKIGAVQSTIILGLFYFTLFLPIGLLYRLLADPLSLRKSGKSNWQVKHSKGIQNLTAAQKQF